jgi:hypothetical protein
LGLLVVVIALHVASFAGKVAVYRFGVRPSAPIVLTAVDSEWNVPAWFSSMLLGVIGLLMVLLGSHKARLGERHARSWQSLGAIFVALSMDEACGFHERLIGPMRELLGAGGIFHFAWVIPGLMFAAVVGLLYLRFLLDLPKRTRWLFITAAALYLGGALGVEMLDGAYASAYGEENLGYRVLTAIEELLEMSGAVLMMYALLDYIGDHRPTAQAKLEVAPAAARGWRSVGRTAAAVAPEETSNIR